MPNTMDLFMPMPSSTNRAPPRRTSTMPIPSAPRPISPQPASAPPAPIKSSPPNPVRLRGPVPKRTKTLESPSGRTQDATLLQAEIERLTAACEEHERKIRAARNSIEHRLFSELPNLLGRLNEYDDSADNASAHLQSAVQSLQPLLGSKLHAIIADREEDLKIMQRRTTPWADFYPEMDDLDAVGWKSKSENTAAHGQRRVERMIAEVDIYLANEKARLAREVKRKRSSSLVRKFVLWAILPVSCLFLAIIIGTILGDS